MKCSSRKGQTTVEYALTLPIFLLIFFGVIDFAVTMHRWSTLNLQCTQAARAGTKRISMLVARDLVTPTTHASLATVQAAFWNNPSPLMATSSYSNVSIVGPDTSSTTVTVSADYTAVMWTPLMSSIMGNLKLHASATEQKE